MDLTQENCVLQCFCGILTFFAGKIRVLKQKSIGARIQVQKGENCEARAPDYVLDLEGAAHEEKIH